jgi:hypothetical protein
MSGVLQLINKLTGSGVFSNDDEDIMQIFLSIAGPILAESNLYEQIQGKSKGRGVEGVGGEVETMNKAVTPSHGHVKKSLAGFAEEDEQDEES